MKQFKIIDFWLSVILIILSIVVAFIEKGDTFFTCYFVVGGWHVISMLVHYFKGWFCEKGNSRYIYQSIVAFILFMGAAGLIIGTILIILLYILLFAAPFMALYYTYLCYKETYVKMQRPLTLLK